MSKAKQFSARLFLAQTTYEERLLLRRCHIALAETIEHFYLLKKRRLNVSRGYCQICAVQNQN